MNHQNKMRGTSGQKDYNNEGEEVFRSHLGEPHGPGFYAFDRLLKEWRDQADMEGLVLGTWCTGGGAPPSALIELGSARYLAEHFAEVRLLLLAWRQLPADRAIQIRLLRMRRRTCGSTAPSIYGAVPNIILNC